MLEYGLCKKDHPTRGEERMNAKPTTDARKPCSECAEADWCSRSPDDKNSVLREECIMTFTQKLNGIVQRRKTVDKCDHFKRSLRQTLGSQVDQLIISADELFCLSQCVCTDICADVAAESAFMRGAEEHSCPASVVQHRASGTIRRNQPENSAALCQLYRREMSIILHVVPFIVQGRFPLRSDIENTCANRAPEGIRL